MKTRSELSRITIDIPKIDHKRLKTLAALHDTSMREIIVQLIEDHLNCSESHYPNKKTRQAIKNTADEKNLIKTKSIDDLFKKLGM